MRSTLAALLAAALAASATPAAACGVFTCFDRAVADDAYPPAVAPLPPSVQVLVKARDDRGLSLAGFYNDPALALAGLDYAPPVYGAEPAPAPTYVVEPDFGAPPAYYGPHHHHRHHGPHVIMSPYGRHAAHQRGPGGFIY